jgi:hypothetical protein
MMPLGFEAGQFDLNYDGIVHACAERRMLAGHAGWVLAPRTRLLDDVVDLATGQSIDRDDVSAVDHPLWHRQGYAVLRYRRPGPDGDVALVHRFRRALVMDELRVLAAAVDWCQSFLGARTSGTQPLTRHPAVVQLLARLVRDVYALRQMDLAQAVSTHAGRHMLRDEIDSACEQLIKLVGGRAMLSGHMVQVGALFSTLNRLYLEDA